MSNTIHPTRSYGPPRSVESVGKRPLPKGIVGIAQMERAQAATRQDAAPSGTLIVGEGIHVKGQVEDCRILVVEGRVEASLKADRLEVRKGGTFVGTAEVDDAEIAGTLDGTLTARNRLAIAGNGRASGKVRYGRLSIEAGGEIRGDVDTYAPAEAEAETEKASVASAGS
jgi:cytoskeletal protein CcmA (bactofilin family)